MGFFSGLKTLFLGGSSTKAKAAEPIPYNGFTIIPAPIPERGQFRVAATITKGEGESLQTHSFIRSDMVGSRDECISLTIRKAQMTIDQSEDRIFN